MSENHAIMKCYFGGLVSAGSRKGSTWSCMLGWLAPSFWMRRPRAGALGERGPVRDGTGFPGKFWKHSRVDCRLIEGRHRVFS